MTDDTDQVLARHEAAMAADRSWAAEHPYRSYVDERGWSGTDEQPFSVLEDVHHLAVRRRRTESRRKESAPDPRRERCGQRFPTPRRMRWADLEPPPF